MQKEGNRFDNKPFPVREILSFNREIKGLGQGLSLDGLTLYTPGELLAHDRFLWVEFKLGNRQDVIRVLGEITERGSQEVKVRFKHIFPHDRRKLADFLNVKALN